MTTQRRAKVEETCRHRDWNLDDVGTPTGPICGLPAAGLSCVPWIDAPTCFMHRCRCFKPFDDPQPTAAKAPGDAEGGTAKREGVRHE